MPKWKVSEAGRKGGSISKRRPKKPEEVKYIKESLWANVKGRIKV